MAKLHRNLEDQSIVDNTRHNQCHQAAEIFLYIVFVRQIHAKALQKQSPYMDDLQTGEKAKFATVCSEQLTQITGQFCFGQKYFPSQSLLKSKEYYSFGRRMG